MTTENIEKQIYEYNNRVRRRRLLRELNAWRRDYMTSENPIRPVRWIDRNPETDDENCDSDCTECAIDKDGVIEYNARLIERRRRRSITIIIDDDEIRGSRRRRRETRRAVRVSDTVIDWRNPPTAEQAIEYFVDGLRPDGIYEIETRDPEVIIIND